MFKINFRFVDEDIEQFRIINYNKFDKDYGDICGQIELIFDGQTVGFYDDEVPFGNELILNWFCRLNEVLVSFSNGDSSHYFAVNIMGTEQWIEFVKGEQLKVSLIKSATQIGVQGFTINRPLLHVDYKEWEGIIIEYVEFKNEIINSTVKLLQQIKELNSDLLISNKLSRIQEYHHLISNIE